MWSYECRTKRKAILSNEKLVRKRKISVSVEGNAFSLRATIAYHKMKRLDFSVRECQHVLTCTKLAFVLFTSKRKLFMKQTR